MKDLISTITIIGVIAFVIGVLLRLQKIDTEISQLSNRIEYLEGRLK